MSLQDKMREAIANATGGCTCDEAYKSRGMADPGCAHCNTDIEGAAKTCAELARQVAISFAAWSASDSIPKPFMTDPKYDLLVDVDDSEEVIRSKAEQLYSLFQSQQS